MINTKLCCDVLLEIFSKLHAGYICLNVRPVCKYWKELSDSFSANIYPNPAEFMREVVKDGLWRQYMFIPPRSLLLFSAEYGKLGGIICAIERGVKNPGHAIPLLAREGHLECLKWIYAAGYKYTGPKAPLLLAASKGHLDIVKWLCESAGYPKYGSVLSAAAEGGHIECLKYLVETGCNWSVFSPFFAAKSGRLNCLIYLIESGCPWDRRSIECAERNNHEDCARFLRKQGILPFNP